MAKTLSSEKQHERMMNTPVPKLVLSLSLPTTVSQLVSVIYNTADTWFVAQISTSASAAVGVVFSLMAIIQALGFGLGMGAGSLVSRKLGEKKDSEAEMYASTAFFTAVSIGALIGTVGLCILEPLMRLMGSTPTMLPYSCDYARYILIGAPVMCASFVLNNVLRSEGEARIAMWGICTGGILNMALDPILIFVFKMGIAGAALSTFISQCVSFTILMVVFFGGKSIVRIRFSAVSRHIKDYGLIIGTGLPTIFRQGLASVASTALNVQASVFGDAAVAAISIANKVYMLIRNIVIGVGQGFQPVAGYNFGAGDKKRTKQAFSFASLLGTAVCIVTAVLIFFFRGNIIAWFRDDAEVIAIGEKMLLYLCAAIPLMAFSTYTNQLYQCLGFKLPATFLASCRQGIFFLPLIYALPHFFAIDGVIVTQSASDVLTAIISVPFLIYFFKKKLNE